MGKKYQVKVDSKSSVPILHLSGEITAFSDEEINEAYKAIKLATPPKLIVNFDGAGYILPQVTLIVLPKIIVLISIESSHPSIVTNHFLVR